MSYLVGNQKGADCVVRIYLAAQGSHCKLSIVLLVSDVQRPIKFTYTLRKHKNISLIVKYCVHSIYIYIIYILVYL